MQCKNSQFILNAKPEKKAVSNVSIEIIDKDLFEKVSKCSGFTFLPLIDPEINNDPTPMLRVASVPAVKQEEAKYLEQFKDDPCPFGAYILSLD